MRVFIERVGDLYRGEAYDDAGHLLLKTNDLATDDALTAQMLEAAAHLDRDYEDPHYELDLAFYEAEERPTDNRDDERRFYFQLGVRAGAGVATESDADWVISELDNPDSLHTTRSLLLTLGHMGAQYEAVVAPYLAHQNADSEAECAMHALIGMGLTDKYADVLVRWMQGSPPPQHSTYSGIYGTASHALRRSGNRKLLQAFIVAANDCSERWTSREHALACLAQAIDLENAPLAQRVSPDDPYMQGVLAKAKRMLAELTSADSSSSP